MRYTLNTEDITHEKIEDEIIAINLKTGTYYSFTGSASIIWTLILEKWTPDEIASHLASLLKKGPEEFLADITGFLDFAVNENLVIPADDIRNESILLPLLQEYKQPVFDKFTDMQELLLVDPIHEVTEEGWPQRRSQN